MSLSSYGVKYTRLVPNDTQAKCALTGHYRCKEGPEDIQRFCRCVLKGVLEINSAMQVQTQAMIPLPRRCRRVAKELPKLLFSIDDSLKASLLPILSKAIVP